jgi:hypothetical protein
MSEDNTLPGSHTPTIAYPTNTMREVANDILNSVHTARKQHDQHWHIVQQYISQCAPTFKPFGISPSFGWLWGDDVSSHMQSVLEPHAQRLTESYDWLEKFAQALIDAADLVDNTDQELAQSFIPQ